MSRLRVVALRAPFVLALALLLTLLAWRSSLLRLVPVELPVVPFGLYVYGAIVLALLPALLSRGPPLAPVLAVAVPVILVASYGAGQLDWLRVLKDFGVSEGSPLDPLRLGASAAALLVAWAMHAADLAHRLRARALERGVAPQQAKRAAGAVLAATARAAGMAAGGTLVLLVVARLAAVQGEGLLPARAAFVAPLVAAIVVAVVAVALARRREDTQAPDAQG